MSIELQYVLTDRYKLHIRNDLNKKYQEKYWGTNFLILDEGNHFSIWRIKHKCIFVK